MESCRAVRIWVRTRIGATRPSVDVQSVPSFTAASNHANAGIPFIKEENRNPNTALDLFGSPSKGLEIMVAATA